MFRLSKSSVVLLTLLSCAGPSGPIEPSDSGSAPVDQSDLGQSVQDSDPTTDQVDMTLDVLDAHDDDSFVDLEIGPDVVEDLGIGSACTTSDECLTGFCYTYPYTGYCTQVCEETSECPTGSKCLPAEGTGAKICYGDCQGDQDCRAVQYCEPEQNVCMPRCKVGSCPEGFECNFDTGACDELGAPCSPSEELCNTQDDDCDGIVDEGCGPTVTIPPEIIALDLGLVPLGAGQVGPEIVIDVPQGVSSCSIVLIPSDQEFLTVWEFRAPDGTLLVDPNAPYAGAVRTIPSQGALSILFPNAPSLFTLEPGSYTLTVVKEGSYEFVPTMVLCKAPVDDETPLKLDINLYFVGIPELSAGTYLEDPKFMDLLNLFWNIMGQINVTPGVTQAFDIVGDDAEKYTFVDKTLTGMGEIPELLALSAAHPESTALNFFFVQDIDNYGALGIAGGIPGPPIFQGTASSGVLVSMADYLAYTGDNESYGLSTTSEAMSHEVGHYLGLFHTSEKTGDLHDPLVDTPECYDLDDDGVVSGQECSDLDANNLMFWVVTGGTVLTGEQSTVVRSNPQLRY